MMGLVTGSIGRVGQGILVASKRITVSEFAKIRSVKVYRKRHTICLNQLLTKNQIYADDADFDFVANYIVERCSTNGKTSAIRE